jgi:sulfatase maturation enzyme AslB (radical SAM superfamily)
MPINTDAIYTFSGRLTETFPSQIIADITEQCNLACVHCSHSEYKKGPLYRGLHMSAEIHAKMVREIVEHGKGSIQYLRYSAMGEPLLHPQIFVFLAEAKRETGTTISLTTNGTLLDAAAASKLFDAGVDIVDISLDALTPESYARVRCGGNHAKTYANIRHFLRERTRLGMPVKIVTTFIDQPDNQGEAESFKSFWESEGADYVIIRRLHSDAGTQKAVAEALNKKIAGITRRPCPYPWERLVVRFNGQIGFCPAGWTHTDNFADFMATTIADAWRGSAMARLRTAHLGNSFTKFPLCAACPDWAQTRWPHEGRSFADMVANLQ